MPVTAEQANRIWSEQSIPPRSSMELAGVIRRQDSKSRFQYYSSLVFLLLYLVFCTVVFYQQFVVEQADVLVTSLRFATLLLAIPIQLMVLRQRARVYRERMTLTASQHDWLAQRVASLEREVRIASYWKLGLFFAAVLTIVCLTKWLDYRNGTDTLVECIVILAGVVAVMVGLSAGIWHHCKTVLIPECERYRRWLDAADRAS